MYVALALVDDSGPNVRTIPPPAGADEAFEQTIAAQGILQPLLCRPVGPTNGLQVVLGHRRFRAAKNLGVIEIPVEVVEMTDAEVQLAQLAENMQRQSMHPIDQWRNIAGLLNAGTAVDKITQALGLDERGVKRMEMLGRLNKTFLTLAEKQMPTEVVLRVIANAPIKTQNTVASGRGYLSSVGETETVHWQTIADRCRVERIERATAIFDPDETDIVWEPDFFARAGDPDEWTTRQTEKFIVEQTKALQVLVRRHVNEGRSHQVAQLNARDEIHLPRGFERVFGADEENLKRNQTVFHAVMATGVIRTVVAIDTSGGTRKSGKNPREPEPEAAAPAAAADPEEDADDEADLDQAVSEEIEDPGRHPLTKDGQKLVAGYKNRALHDAIDELIKTNTPKAQLTSASLMIRLMVLALCSDNLEVYRPRGDVVDFKHLSRRLLEPGGNLLNLSMDEILEIGSAALRSILVFGGPEMTDTAYESGPPAETIAHILNAADKLPRFDTKEFLATVKSWCLRDAAIAHEMKPATSVAGMRAQLEGKMPTWRPASAFFGAPTSKNKSDER